MPHAAIHLMLAHRAVDAWRAHNAAPFDIDSDGAINAFKHGSLAPDMGYYPGGNNAMARVVHTRATGDTQRALFDFARTEEQLAFAWGWLTHVLADALIHPLVNEDAARRRQGDVPHVVEHVRVEAGLDVWFGGHDPSLAGLRLRPAFNSAGYRFLASALDAASGFHVRATNLARWERNVILSCRGALHFVQSLARQVCWNDVSAARAPRLSSLGVRALSRLSPRHSIVKAYLTPHVPEPALVHKVEDALLAFDRMLDAIMSHGLHVLPNYNLETGALMDGVVDLRLV